MPSGQAPGSTSLLGQAIRASNQGKHLEARLVPASVGRRHVRQVASHVDEQRRRHGCEFRQDRPPVMKRPHEPRILTAISMQGRRCVGHPIGNQVHSVGHQRQSSALSGSSNWQSSALSGPSNRQSSALTFHTTRWLLSDLMREAIRGHHPRSSSRQMLSDLMRGAIKQVISGNQSMAMRESWGYLMRLRIRGDVTKREQSGRPLVEIT